MAATQYRYRSGHPTELAALELVDRVYGQLEKMIFLVQYFAIFQKHLIAFHIKCYLIN